MTTSTWISLVAQAAFTLMLNWSDFGFFGFTGGAGDYRIIIGEPEEYVAPSHVLME